MKIQRILTLAGLIFVILFPAASQTASELLEKGHEAYLDYRFEEAAKYYGQAKKKLKKTDTDLSQLYDTYMDRLEMADNFLGRVEKIVIIDSISVPKQDFFKHYRLPASSGHLGGASELPYREQGVDYVFTNEGEDYKIWAQPDSVGTMRLMESSLLGDGRWSEPAAVDDDLSEGGNAIYPFMMADGVTLYYSDNGENSLGGYDIMVATRDAGDGTFMQPSNIGFPYNSPYDDYLLAIDELNGVGWWATDRNQLEDELTVYVFVVNDLRQNYDSGEDDMAAFARIDNYLATQPEDADYDSLLATIHAIDPNQRNLKPEFFFPAPGGMVYHRYDELPDAKSRAALKKYLSESAALQKAENELTALRKKYHGYPSESLAARIRKEESAIEQKRKEVLTLKNNVYKAF